MCNGDLFTVERILHPAGLEPGQLAYLVSAFSTELQGVLGMGRTKTGCVLANSSYCNVTKKGGG